MSRGSFGLVGKIVLSNVFFVGSVAAIAVAAMTTSAGALPSATSPVVIELFQSQGCSSCPPANANVMALIDRPDVLALSFQVTYWDDLGWKDTFATPANTQRQWDYAQGLHNGNVYTPQIVINGTKDIVGVDASELKREISRASLPPAAPQLSLSVGSVTVGAASTPKLGADVWLVRYDPRVVQVAIKRGENGGRTLPHRNVVRELVRLDAWFGASQFFALPSQSDPAYRTAILVQGVKGGRIIAALNS